MSVAPPRYATTTGLDHNCHHASLYYIVSLLVTRRGTLLMEWGLLHDFFENFSTRGERYYFMRGEIEPM